MMISTPTNPIKIALQRRQPTFSPKKIAANIVTVSGNDWRIAVTLASGILDKAVRKAIVAPSSENARTNTTSNYADQYG